MGTTKFKEGNRVFSYALQQWGTVEEEEKTYTPNVVIVRFDGLKDIRIYTEDGRLFDEDKAPDLFYDKVSITPPLKPLPDLKVDDKVIVWNNPKFKYYRHFAGWKDGGEMGCFTDGGTSWSNPNDIYVWENWEIVKEKEN